ncbi:MAG: sulfurtransferase TusC [Gammaproteobacteria bacterium RBG_16_51_14]|nr:MAG: sulfurtransferase TusC [Gammaproteobacteria bacterium RBG_16_51_14]
MSTKKRIMIVNHRPPHGTLHAWESLDLTLTAAAFEQEVSVVFMGDGVFQLLADQDTSQINIKNFAPAYRTFRDYDIRHVYVEKEALARRGLSSDDLLIDVNLVDTGALCRLMTEQDIILHF